jgi:hypothetical protein
MMQNNQQYQSRKDFSKGRSLRAIVGSLFFIFLALIMFFAVPLVAVQGALGVACLCLIGAALTYFITPEPKRNKSDKLAVQNETYKWGVVGRVVAIGLAAICFAVLIFTLIGLSVGAIVFMVLTSVVGIVAAAYYQRNKAHEALQSEKDFEKYNKGELIKTGMIAVGIVLVLALGFGILSVVLPMVGVAFLFVSFILMAAAVGGYHYLYGKKDKKNTRNRLTNGHMAYLAAFALVGFCIFVIVGTAIGIYLGTPVYLMPTFGVLIMLVGVAFMIKKFKPRYNSSVSDNLKNFRKAHPGVFYALLAIFAITVIASFLIAGVGGIGLGNANYMAVIIIAATLVFSILAGLMLGYGNHYFKSSDSKSWSDVKLNPEENAWEQLQRLGEDIETGLIENASKEYVADKLIRDGTALEDLLSKNEVLGSDQLWQLAKNMQVVGGKLKHGDTLEGEQKKIAQSFLSQSGSEDIDDDTKVVDNTGFQQLGKAIQGIAQESGGANALGKLNPFMTQPNQMRQRGGGNDDQNNSLDTQSNGSLSPRIQSQKQRNSESLGGGNQVDPYNFRGNTNTNSIDSNVELSQLSSNTRSGHGTLRSTNGMTPNSVPKILSSGDEQKSPTYNNETKDSGTTKNHTGNGSTKNSTNRE